MKKNFLSILFICVSVLISHALYAESQKEKIEIFLKNGDKISGAVLSENEQQITVYNDALGEVAIAKEYIEEGSGQEKQAEVKTIEKRAQLWKKEISLGYNKSSGNTESSQLATKLTANRKTENDEFTIKANSFYSSSDDKMDAQKWYGMLRYAFSFEQNKWFNFYKLEADHDRFANIDYRIIPSAGLGYWFSDTQNWKSMAELGIGFQHTSFRDNTDDENEVILIPHAFIEKVIFAESKISQDITAYPSLSEAGNYRLHSESVFTNPISDNLSFSLSFIWDYNSNPPSDTKKSDTQIISALNYSF